MIPSISSKFFSDQDIYKMPKSFLEAGFSASEINQVHFNPFMRGEADAKEYRKYIDDLGFSFPQGHLVFMNEGNITSIDNEYAIGNLKRNLDIFHTLGVKCAVIHYSNFGNDIVPIEDWFDVRVDALNQLTKHIEGSDMIICIENLSRVHDIDAGHLLKMCKAVDNPKHIGICMDTGHLNVAQKGNQYDFIMQAGNWLKALHIHDNRGPYYGLEGLPCDWHIMPFAGGNLNWEDVRRGLKNANYQGAFNFELGAVDFADDKMRKLILKHLFEMYKLFFEF